jgi:hypothetical protein
MNLLERIGNWSLKFNLSGLFRNPPPAPAAAPVTPKEAALNAEIHKAIDG